MREAGGAALVPRRSRAPFLELGDDEREGGRDDRRGATTTGAAR